MQVVTPLSAYVGCSHLLGGMCVDKLMCACCDCVWEEGKGGSKRSV